MIRIIKMEDKKMKKILALLLASAMTFAMVGCSQPADSGSSTEGGEAPAGETYELKISTTQTDTSMIYQGLKAAADQIMEETNGAVEVSIYPAGSLGVEEDMIDQALAGIGVAVLTDAGRMSSYVNDIGIFNMAYLVDNYEDGVKVMETETFKGWTNELVDQNIRVLSFKFYDGARSFMGNVPATTPAELNGQVTRTPNAAPWNASISAMGATPYNLAWGDVYNSIQTKAIDACEVQYTSAVSTKIYEVCDYVNKTEHINLFNCLIVGETWFQTLPEEYQTIVLNAFDEASYNNALDIVAAQADMEQTLVDNGMEIIEVDKEAFKTAVEAAYAEMGWTELRQQIYTEAGLN